MSDRQGTMAFPTGSLSIPGPFVYVLFPDPPRMILVGESHLCRSRFPLVRFLD